MRSYRPAHASIFCRIIGRRTCRCTPARRVDLVDRLLEHSAEVNSTTAEGWTPLHLAAHGGSLELAERFLSRGASIGA